jgi:hypothetical protein
MPVALAILTCALAAGACHPSADPGTQSWAVRVTARAGESVRLTALDVPAGWIASFCTPRVCSPFRVTLALRTASGTIQLSYVRAQANAAALRTLHLAAHGPAGYAELRRPAVL